MRRLLAVGSGMAAVDAVLAGRGAATPMRWCARLAAPRHGAHSAMGFCIFNNIVIAARHAQRGLTACAA